jgi:hypothetical protein
VRYEGDTYHFESPELRGPLVIVEGDNGTGKSTFCNLIYYALGGSVPEFRKDGKRVHQEIALDTNAFVELDISLSPGEKYRVRRFINDGEITVTELFGSPLGAEIAAPDGKAGENGKKGVPAAENGSASVEPSAEDVLEVKDAVAQNPVVWILPVRRSDAKPQTFSDWLTEKLGVSVIEIYNGSYTFKLGVTDLFRLVYHDQALNPARIVKSPDTDTFVTESEMVRKAIFQLWMGKAYSDFYDSVSAEKRADKEKSISKSLLDEYRRMSSILQPSSEPRNISFLTSDLHEKQDQLEKLHAFRNGFKRDRQNREAPINDMESLAQEILEGELEKSNAQEALVSLYEEKSKLAELTKSVLTEMSQITKIIHAHEQLHLFSADTCPYCLSAVDRLAGKCVCGADIDESQYERFFYSAREYKDILKAKQKTLATVRQAIDDCNAEEIELRTAIDHAVKAMQEKRRELSRNAERVAADVDIDRLNDIDDKILEVRGQIATIEQAIEVEKKLGVLQKRYENALAVHEESKIVRNEKQVAMERDIRIKVASFSRFYNDFMTNALPECKSARIDLEDYMPIVDEGVYREASSEVPRRLMYYLTLMQMALSEPDVMFPRFLLIDTPETAGIESDRLVRAIGQIGRLHNERGLEYQIILSTGLKKYPQEFSDKVVLLLTKDQKLLRLRDGAERVF